MCTAALKRDHPVAFTGGMSLSPSPSCFYQEEAVAARPIKKRRQDCCVSPDPTCAPLTYVPARRSSMRSAERSPKPSRRVSFASTAWAAEVPRRSPEELAAAWYSPLDNAVFKLQETTDAALLRSLISQAADLSQLPREAGLLRGLERLLSPQIVAEIRGRRKDVVKSVIMEQRRIRASGFKVEDEAERLAQASQGISGPATAWARCLGLA